MFRRSPLVTLTAILLAVACSPDTPSAPSTTSVPSSGRRNLETGEFPEAVPLTFTLLPSTVVGGDPGTPSGAVTVANTETFDRYLHVTSNNSTVLPYLSSGAVVPAYSTRAGVMLLPAAVTVPTVVTIYVTGDGVTVSADLTVNPPGTPPPAPTLSSYTVSPASVMAGAIATGTITLPTPAPAGGVIVELSSRIPGSAIVPPSVTVPEGATRVSFQITTFAGFPNSTTSVLLSARNGDTVIFSSIDVVTPADTTPTSPAPVSLGTPKLLSPSADQRFSPGKTITFDWSDVTGADSYTLQIDDRDDFPAPLVMGQVVTASQFSSATLPTRTMWWRVRATTAAGAVGPWSSARRFEVK